MSDTTKPTAPKFASFRPKPAVPASKSSQVDTNEKPHKDNKERDGDGHSKSHGGRRRRSSPSKERKSKQGDRELDTRRHNHGIIKDQAPVSVAAHSREDETEYYIVDRKGDPANVAFGRVHRYNVPLFRRYGYGRVFGLPKNQRIDLEATTEQAISIRIDDNRGRPERQWALKYKPSKEPRVLRLIRPDAEDKRLNSSLDYISMKSNKKRKRGSESPGLPHEDTVDYRSIEGQAKASAHPADSDLEYQSDQSNQDHAGSANSEEEIRLKNAALSSHTKEAPRDLQAWLKLIDHQQDMVLLGRPYPSREPSASERRNIADIRISIYTQALREIRVKQDRVQLVIGLMNEGKHYWESKQLARRWQETLNEYPDSVELWTNYLDFAQTNFVDFKYENCRGTFRTCLEMLAKARDATPVGGPSWTTLVEIQVYVLLRLASLAKEAGYHEHGVAIWQALLEHHMFRPSKNQGTVDPSGLLSSFEEFWESEVSRIGEVDAKGWNKFDALQTPVPESVVLSFRTIVPSLRVFDDFSVLEDEHMAALRLPGRTADDCGDDDPFHLILFSDIQEFLSLLPDNFPHDALIEAFLCFWHLPPLSFESTSERQYWWQDSFLRDEAIETSPRERSSLPANDEPQTTGGFSISLRAFSDFSMKSLQMTTGSLFEDAFQQKYHLTDLGFIRRALKQLAATSADDRVAEYYLAFEQQHFPDTARKSAKQLLKKRPTSLRLWNVYALIEARTGATETSDFVFCTALEKVKSLPDVAQRDNILLWHTWIWEALDHGDVASAAHRVTSIGNEKPTARPGANFDVLDLSAADTLRTKNILRDGRDHCLLTARYASFVLYVSCDALLSYLLNKFDIDAALAIYHDASKAFDKRDISTSPAAELHHQAQARLLAYHASQSHSFKPSLIRAKLAQSVELFPNNTLLLSIYAANESRFRIDGRVRAIMSDVVLRHGGSRGQAPSVVGWAFAIFSEMNRGEALGSTAHSVRATFEKAVESDCGRNSQALWTSYVLFEVAQRKPSSEVAVQSKKAKAKSLEPDDRAKKVFFRGLTRLPWCKPYMMLAFSHLTEMLTFQELRGVYNVLGEEELRVHVDLEEAFEEFEEARAGATVSVAGLISPEDPESDED
ncbi:DUF1740-domain-containing protein [Lophium mytilinum]|uniref:DUF1740-domain-containing protein n=1 Tax=Lophium mytilinum TaxID=390894 RepID=A0A6A6R163_9PEZI|nr:DUF1740-domain-containing protein [Lophium mytilinum]